MSYDPRGRPVGAPGSREDADAKKGSVRAARQRMQVAQMRNQLPDTSKIIGLPQRPNELLSRDNSRVRPVDQEQPTSSSNGKALKVSPPPEWPLPNDDATMSGFSPVIPLRSPKRLQSPQQTDRPLSDEFPLQEASPTYAQQSADYLQPPSKYRQPSPTDEMFSPSTYRSSRPLTTSSMASEASSLGSIPDFPVPQPPMPSIQQNQQARRMPSLGPPPSSRRGPSSYYTQMSYVSPIVEESDTRSRHGSYASSNVFPMHRDSYTENEDLYSDDDSTMASERGTISPAEPDDRRSLVQQSPALLRQASMGRRTKPSLMTIKSVDSMGKGKPEGSKNGAGIIGAGAAASAGQGLTSIGARNVGASSSSSSLRNMQLAGAYGDMSENTPQEETRPTTLAERAGMRRPPRLDMDAVRDAEARGSLTSLPELIRRATRLAANLDRGKTASRLGLDFWEAGAPDRRDVRQSGLSDMLAAFPHPGQDTPGSRASKWPSGRGESRAGVTDSAMSKEKPKQRRRCCGMPLWTFVTLLIVLLFIIAAAVVIPVVLIVIPNQNKGNMGAVQGGQGNGNGGSNNGGNGNGNSNDNSFTNISPPRPAPTLAPGDNQCDGVINCQNGGISILNPDRSCNCVCINGFTGRTCTNNDATGCTTTTIPGTANNATMGTAISRLLDSTVSETNIPLNSTRVLSLFSELSLSCAAQNALITFNGLASRSEAQALHSINLRHILEPSRSLPNLHHPHPARIPEQKAKRQAIGAPGSPGPAVTKAAEPSATPTQPVSSNVEALDFARTGVLFAMQETGELDVAAKAQESIQNFLTSNRNGDGGNNNGGNNNGGSSELNIGPFKMDLIRLTLTLNNGTVIRASASSS